jgi:hypothetical protein
MPTRLIKHFAVSFGEHEGAACPHFGPKLKSIPSIGDQLA